MVKQSLPLPVIKPMENLEKMKDNQLARLHGDDSSYYFLTYVLFFHVVFMETLRIDLVFLKSMHIGEKNDTLKELDYFFTSMYPGKIR